MIPAYMRHRFRNVGGVEARLVFHLGPLAPSPELGHVDTEETPQATAAGEHERPVGAAS
jgi:putative monooxygenase